MCREILDCSYDLCEWRKQERFHCFSDQEVRLQRLKVLGFWKQMCSHIVTLLCFTRRLSCARYSNCPGVNSTTTVRLRDLTFVTFRVLPLSWVHQ